MAAGSPARLVVTSIAHSIAVEGARGAGQDRAVVVVDHDRLVVALADGAGGTANGDAAAQAVIDTVVREAMLAFEAESLLIRLDDELLALGGQATAIVARLDGERICGASVGDSGAWLITSREIVDLTNAQRRKPLVGDGCCPVAFEASISAGATLVVASDGLLRYASRGDIARVVRGQDVETAARALIDLVRLPAGTLQDDVSIVLCQWRAI